MPLSSMLSKVSKEISNYKMDSDGNIVKKKKDPYQEQSYGGGGGGSYGYSHGHGSSNKYGYSNGGYSSGGYGHGGYHNGEGYDGRYGAPQYEQDPYARPPQGPPPGYHGGHSQYGPPGGAPSGRSRLPFNPKMEMWSEVASDGNTYFFLGDRRGSTEFSAKMPTMSGNLVVSAGGRKHSSNVLGEAKDAGISKSSSVVSLPNGFRCDLQKNSFKQIGQTSYTFTVPTDGGKKETFMWRLDDQGIKDMMKGKATGWSLIRADEYIKPTKENPQPPAPTPLAKFIDEEGMGLSSKMKMGWVEFVGEGAAGSLGHTWAAVALVAIVKAKAKQAEKTIIQEVVGAV